MTALVLTRDAAFRAWLAARPGLWLEVGVFDDAAMLVALMAERRRAELPRLAARRARSVTRSRHRNRPAPVGVLGIVGLEASL